MVQDTPSRKLDQYIVRFPDGLRDRIKAAAEENKRSMNAEIIARLEASFSFMNKLEEIDSREDDLKLKITEMQADLIAFMLMQGKDPAEVRKMWTESAEKIKAERIAEKAKKP